MNEDLDTYTQYSYDLWKTISTLNKVKTNYAKLIEKNNTLKGLAEPQQSKSESLFDFTDIIEALGNGYLDLLPEEIPARNKLLLEKIESMPQRIRRIEEQLKKVTHENTLLELRRLTPMINFKP